MSIGNINGYANWWQWREKAAPAGTSTDPATTTTVASTTSGGPISNSGSITASGSVTSFVQALSADLQAMLAQTGGTTTTASEAGSAGDKTAVNAAADVAHHHHHHHASSADDGAIQLAANRLLGGIGQGLQNGTMSPDQISQSASVFATDVVRALQSYAGTAASGRGTPILA